MAPRRSDPDRSVEGTTLRVAMERLAARVARDSGGSRLRALADIRAAVEANIRTAIWGGLNDAEILLTRVLTESSPGAPGRGLRPGPTWRLYRTKKMVDTTRISRTRGGGILI